MAPLAMPGLCLPPIAQQGRNSSKCVARCQAGLGQDLLLHHAQLKHQYGALAANCANRRCLSRQAAVAACSGSRGRHAQGLDSGSNSSTIVARRSSIGNRSFLDGHQQQASSSTGLYNNIVAQLSINSSHGSDAGSSCSSGDQPNYSNISCTTAKSFGHRGSSSRKSKACGRGNTAGNGPGNQQLTGAGIMRQLKAAKDWQELQQLVQQHMHRLNWRHSSAVVTHLAQLTAQQQQQHSHQQQHHQRQLQQQDQHQQQNSSNDLQLQHSKHISPVQQPLQQVQHAPQHSRRLQQSMQQSQSNRDRHLQQAIQQAAVGLMPPSSSSNCNSSAGLKQFLQDTVNPLIDRHLEQYDSRGLANTLWALARLHGSTSDTNDINSVTAAAAASASSSGPSRRWLARFSSISQLLLQQFDAQQLSNTLWGFVQLQYQPTHPWLREWYAAMEAQLQRAAGVDAADVQPQALSSALWAVANVCGSNGAGSSSSRPPNGWVDQLLAVVADGLWCTSAQHASSSQSSSSTSTSSSVSTGNSSHSDSSADQVVSNLLWACAQLQHHPDRRFLVKLEKWLQRAAIQQQQLGAQGLANMLWALGKLKQHHQQQQEDQEQQAGQGTETAASVGTVDPDCERKESGSKCSMSGQRNATTAWNTGAYKKQQRKHNIQQCGIGNVESSSSGSRGDGQHCLLRSCGQLLLAASADQLPELSWRHVSNIAWAAAVLHLQPSQHWMQLLSARLKAEPTALQDQQVANLLWALSHFRMQAESMLAERPGLLKQQVITQLLDAQQGKLGSYSSQALSSTLLSLARLRVKPAEPVLQAWLRELARRNYVLAAGGRALAETCCALAVVRQQGQEVGAASSSSSNRDSKAARGSLSAIAVQQSFDAEWLAGACTVSASRLSAFCGDHLAGMGWAFAALQFRPPVAWLSAWHAALQSKAAAMPAATAARALWALQQLPAGNAESSRDEAAAALAEAVVAAAAAGGCDSCSLAVTALCIAARAQNSAAGSLQTRSREANRARHKGSVPAAAAAASLQTHSSSNDAAQAVQQLLLALLPVLDECSSQHMVTLLSAAAKVHAPVSPQLLRALQQHTQQLAAQGLLTSKAVASITAAGVKLAASKHHAQQGLQSQQAQQQKVAKLWVTSMLGAFEFTTAGASELVLLLWALAVAGYNPGVSWLRCWVQHSKQLLPSFTTSDLASSGWALTVLNYRPDHIWCASWVQCVGQQAAAASAKELALMLYAAATLRCTVGRLWLLSAASVAAGTICKWSVPDLATGLWGLARLGLRSVADGELLEVLLGEAMSTSAADIQALSQHQQLQLLQAVVLLQQPRYHGLDPQDATSGWQTLSKLQRSRLPGHVSRTAVRRLRWAARQANKRVLAAAARAAAAHQQAVAQQQQWRPFIGYSSVAFRAPSQAGPAALPASMAAVDAAVADAAEATAAYVTVSSGRSPGAVGPPVDASWLAVWCQAPLQQLNRWSPSTTAAALSAFAALGVQPPLTWQQQVLQHALSGSPRCTKWQEASAIADALAALQSPLCSYWASQMNAKYAPLGVKVKTITHRQLQQRQQLDMHQQGQRGTVNYPQKLTTHALLQLQRQQRLVRLVAWWRQEQQRNQQRRQRQYRRQQQLHVVPSADGRAMLNPSWQQPAGQLQMLRTIGSNIKGSLAQQRLGAGRPVEPALSSAGLNSRQPSSWHVGGLKLAQPPARQVGQAVNGSSTASCSSSNNGNLPAGDSSGVYAADIFNSCQTTGNTEANCAQVQLSAPGNSRSSLSAASTAAPSHYLGPKAGNGVQMGGFKAVWSSIAVVSPTATRATAVDVAVPAGLGFQSQGDYKLRVLFSSCCT